MVQKMRINCVEVIVDGDLNVTYRLTLPLKEEYLTNLPDIAKVRSYVKNNKVRYHYVVESADKNVIIKEMTAAQVLISSYNIMKMSQRHEYLLTKLTQI